MKEINIPSPETVNAMKESVVAKVQKWHLKERMELLQTLLRKAKRSIQSMLPKN